MEDTGSCADAKGGARHSPGTWIRCPVMLRRCRTVPRKSRALHQRSSMSRSWRVRSCSNERSLPSTASTGWLQAQSLLLCSQLRLLASGRRSVARRGASGSGLAQPRRTRERRAGERRAGERGACDHGVNAARIWSAVARLRLSLIFKANVPSEVALGSVRPCCRAR